MTVERVNISVTDDCLSRIDDLLIRLQHSGMQIEAVFASIGVVSGTIDGARLDDLRHVDGVNAVEHDRTVHPTTDATHQPSAKPTGSRR